jgi:hypothetical protein|tara:strand:+ start:178 stop:387 length:210 start_codon:yes stop_codon:yes gene_type:complete
MAVVRVPDRIETIHGSLDSGVMTTKTVETIMNIFTRSKHKSKVRDILHNYYRECIEKNQQISGKWASKK